MIDRTHLLQSTFKSGNSVQSSGATSGTTEQHTMNIPFLDLKAAYLELQPKIDAAIKRVLDSGWYIFGEEVDAFEREYAAYCEAKHCVGVANGLDALHLALIALRVGAG